MVQFLGFNGSAMYRCVWVAAAVILSAGCAHKPVLHVGVSIPKGATKLVSGSGAQNVTVTVNNDGTAFVLDDTLQDVVATGPIKAGQTVSINPKVNTVSFGSSHDEAVKLIPEDTYSIYFKQASIQ